MRHRSVKLILRNHVADALCSFGARCMAASMGVILNNHMSEFTLPRPLPPVLGYAPNDNNYIEPGKRPMTTMAPSLLVDTKGDAVLVIGASGGARIVSSVSFVSLTNRTHCVTLRI